MPHRARALLRAGYRADVVVGPGDRLAAEHVALSEPVPCLAVCKQPDGRVDLVGASARNQVEASLPRFDGRRRRCLKTLQLLGRDWLAHATPQRSEGAAQPHAHH